MRAYYPYAKTVYQGEKWMTIQFMLNWFEEFHQGLNGTKMSES